MAEAEPVSTGSETSHGIPANVIDWLEIAIPGKVTRRERSVSRREGWWVDLESADGGTVKGFLRLERFSNGRIKQPTCQVRLETSVIAALHARGIPVPAVHAHSSELQATLYERMPGEDNIHELECADQQRAIALDFMRHIARVHSLSAEELDLPDLPRPVSPEDYALAGIDDLEKAYASSASVPDPLALLTFHWLRRHVPLAPERPVLVQGDTGPGNFVFVGDRVSAILDWECAHLGDPMEDLGHLYSRAFFHPWGEMQELLDEYSAAGREPLSRDKLHFYRIASFAKAALGSTTAVNYFRPEGPLPMMIYFSVAGERGLAASLAEALGVEIEDASLPEPQSGLPDSLRRPTEQVSAFIVEHELSPQLSDPYLRSRAVQLQQLASYQARRERHLSAVVAQELDELRALLKSPVQTIEDGLAALNAKIEAWDEPSIPDITRYLTRRAQRAEALALPLAGRYANPVLSRIEPASSRKR